MYVKYLAQGIFFAKIIYLTMTIVSPKLSLLITIITYFINTLKPKVHYKFNIKGYLKPINFNSLKISFLYYSFKLFFFKFLSYMMEVITELMRINADIIIKPLLLFIGHTPEGIVALSL